MSRGKVWQYPDFVRLFHTSTPLRSVELCKEWRGVRATRRRVGHYSHFVRLFTTASAPPHPLRSVELSKEGKNSGFHGQGWTWLSLKVLTVSFPDIFPLRKFEKVAWHRQGSGESERYLERLPFMENPVIPGRIQMEPFIPVETFHRKKATPLEVLPFSRFYRNDRNFSYHLSG